MNTLHAQILTPEGAKFEGDVTGVQMPGKLGSFEVKYNHAALVSMLDIGQIRIRHQSGEDDTILAVAGGFVEVSDNQLTLLAETAEKASEIDKEAVQRELKEAKEQLEANPMNREDLEWTIRQAENRLKIAES